MSRLLTLVLPLLALPVIQACPTKYHNATTACAQVTGNQTVNSFQLYPENADFDTKRCVAYFRQGSPNTYQETFNIDGKSAIN